MSARTLSDAMLHHPPSVLETEAVVLGSGPGGAITAAVLAESGYETLVLEAGGAWAQGDAEPFGADEMTAAYARRGMTVALGRCPVNYVMGRCVGGGSEVNSGLYHPPPPAMLQRWGAQAHGADDAALAEMAAANERDVNVVLPPGAVQPASARLAAGAQVAGVACAVVPRWHRYDGTYAPLVPGGVRQSMSETFLPRFAAAGGRVLPHCSARRLEAQGGGWKVHARARDGFVTVLARDVFVAAGAVGTPILLRRSGVKNQVGDSLRMHIFVRVVAEFDEAVNAAAAGIGPHQAETAAVRMGCAVSTPAHLAVALAQAGAAAWLADHDARWRHRAAYYVSAAVGAGRVRAVGGDEAVWYRLAADDFYTLADGVRQLAQVLFAGGARRVLPVVGGAPTLRSAADLWRLPRPLLPAHCRLSSVHLMASCPMGAAADSFGRVYGRSGLHIADSSLFYDSPNVNPQGTLMAFARRNAMTFVNARQTTRQSAKPGAHHK